MTVLLTGAAGFIGMHVAEALLDRGERVLGVDNLSPYYDVRLKRARLARLEAHAGFTFIEADVADREVHAAAGGGASRADAGRASGGAARGAAFAGGSLRLCRGECDGAPGGARGCAAAAAAASTWSMRPPPRSMAGTGSCPSARATGWIIRSRSTRRPSGRRN